MLFFDAETDFHALETRPLLVVRLALNEDRFGGEGFLTVVPDTDCLGTFFFGNALVVQGEIAVIKVNGCDSGRQMVGVEQDREALEYQAFYCGDVV